MDLSGISYVGFRRVIERGTAEIIEETDKGILLCDTVSGVYMLASDDEETGKALIDRNLDRKITLLETTSKEVGEYAGEKYGLDKVEECWQFAYTGDAPEEDPRLTVRTAELSDLTVIMKVYDMVSEEEMARDIRRGSVLMAYDGDDLVGFIGEHLEGSMGMLYVYPEFRHKGYASALENIGFSRTIKRGETPYGQVISDNTASYNLQKKKGLEQADKMIYWVFKDQEQEV